MQSSGTGFFFFTQYNSVEIHPSCFTDKEFILFYCFPQYGYITLCANIHPLKDIWVVSVWGYTNKAALEIVEMLRNNITTEDIIKQLGSKYDNDDNVLSQYVLETINILKSNNLLEE